MVKRIVNQTFELAEKIDNDYLDKVFNDIEMFLDDDNKDIILDFSNVVSLSAEAILRLCAFIMYCKSTKDIAVELTFGKNHNLKKEMINNNWAHFMDDQHPISSFKGYLYTPALNFRNEEEHQKTINKILEILLEAYSEFDRGSFSTIEWFLCEVMDNVLVHSHSQFGGLVQIKVHRNLSKDIEIVVADAGVGIPTTLKDIYSNKTESELLMSSINEGVTNGKGQGNGLFGASEICRKTDGEFTIYSGSTRLRLIKDGKETKPLRRNFSGTTICARIKTNDKVKLNEALKFKGKLHKPIDYIELQYESEDNNSIYKYQLDRKTDAVGSRPYGNRLRNKLLNILHMSESIRAIQLDFINIDVISHSFADELISKIIEMYGVDYFINHVRLINCNSKIQLIINNVVSQRNGVTISFEDTPLSECFWQ